MKKTVFSLGILLLILRPVSCQEAEPRIGFGTAILLNVIPGFGVGSRLQGDLVGAAILVSIDLVKAGFIIGGFVWALGISLDVFPWDEEDDFWDDVLYATFTVTWLASKAFAILRPIWYTHRKDAERRSTSVSFGVVPSIIPTTDPRAVDVGCALFVRCAIE